MIYKDSNKMRYTVKDMKFPYKVGLLVLFVLFSPLKVGAVHISLDIENATQNNLDTFYVPIRIDTQGECINAVRVALGYNPTNISIHDVSIANSILTLWTKTPTVEMKDGVEAGRVVFEGGIPGGYCGRVSGDPGMTNMLAKLVVSGVQQPFEENEVKNSQIVVEPSTKVFLHDGIGSEASTTALGLEFFLTESTTTSSNIWLSDVRSDEVAPQDFDITLVKGPSNGNNKHYIVFNTIDKQSGVDHYEILETDPDKFGFLTWISKEAHWVVGKSPFVLRDQNLQSKIMVKAVDKNGNERISVLTPEMSVFSELGHSPVLATILFIILLLCFLLFLFYKRKKRNMKKQETE